MLALARESQTGRFLDIHGQQVHVREHGVVDGSRSPALLVHGHFGSSRLWSPLVARLAKITPCIAVDLPGFGLTPPPSRFDTGATAKTVAALAAAVSDQPVHLIGNSYGGTVALWAAANYPRMVSTLTLISPPVSVSPLTGSLTRCAAVLYRLCSGARGLRQRLSRMDAAQLARFLLSECCHDVGSLSPAVLADATRDASDALRDQWRFLSEAASFRAMASTLIRTLLPNRFSLLGMASRIKIPTLILWGAKDRMLPVSHARELTRLMPTAKLAVLPVTGHAPHLEAPERAAAIIGSYIAAHG